MMHVTHPSVLSLGMLDSTSAFTCMLGVSTSACTPKRTCRVHNSARAPWQAHGLCSFEHSRRLACEMRSSVWHVWSVLFRACPKTGASTSVHTPSMVCTQRPLVMTALCPLHIQKPTCFLFHSQKLRCALCTLF